MDVNTSPGLFAIPPPSDYPYDLGDYSFSIDTTSADCQTWFNRGLTWSYAFHHAEAERCFGYAIHADPSACLPYWGIAYAHGPNYNRANSRDLDRQFARCRTALQLGRKRARSELERGLVEALFERFPEDRESAGGKEGWNRAYMLAMERVQDRFPSELEVVALFADALMAIAPWRLWDLHTGEPNSVSRTTECLALLQAALDRPDGRARRHPFILHLFIHLMELSPTPELAVPAAGWLRELVPDGGHLNHMPAHIDLLVGDYAGAIRSSTASIRGDEKYALHGSSTDFYSFYRLHDYSFAVYAAMMSGQYAVAMDVCGRMEAALTDELVYMREPPMIDWLEGFMPYRAHVLVRFGKWHEVLALPVPSEQEYFAVTITSLHYARGIAYSVLGDTAAARAEYALFSASRLRVPPS